MSPSHTIRPAVETDFEQLCELFEELDEHHRSRRPDLFRAPPGERRERTSVVALIAGPDSTILVAQAPDTRLLGLVTVAIKTTPQSIVRLERRFAEIDNLVVRSQAQRCGIAQALVDAASLWVAAQGLTSVELNVWAFNRSALAFYEAAGFTDMSRRLIREVP